MLSNGSYTRTMGHEARDLPPEFFMDTVKDEPASVAAGREIFREIERVKIIIPGMQASVAVHNVTDVDRQRWPQHYEAFRKGQDTPIIGTPLEEWPLLNRSMVKELKSLAINTIEDLANLSDYQVQSLGMGGQMLRRRAKGFLSSAERESLTSQLTAENDTLRLRVSTLENQLKELSAQVSTLLMHNRLLVERPDPVTQFVQGDHDPMQPQQRSPVLVASSLDAFAKMGAGDDEPPAVVPEVAAEAIRRSRHGEPKVDDAA